MRWRFRALLWTMLAVGLWLGHRYTCHLWSDAPTYARELDRSGTLLIVGDFQRTSVFERWVLRREQNDAERGRLVRALSREDDVAGLLLLGDLVFDGSSCGDWETFDALLAPLREHGVVLALGNHDYWGPNIPACRQVAARFPWLAEQSWELVRWGNVALVALDSNEDELGPERWSAQERWLDETLDALDADEAIMGVVLMAHHSPYTNSEVTSDEAHVQRAFVSRLADHAKPMLFLSGHAHTYEHFLDANVHYVVSGGGGGPRVTLLQGDDARHDDLFDGPSPRPFHYLRLGRSDEGLTIEVHGFRTGETAVGQLDDFTIPWR